MQPLPSLILTLCFISSTFAAHSPVFLWGGSRDEKHSLQTISSEEFAKVVKPLLADKALVIFLENDLNTKDFLCTNNADKSSCYAHLQSVGDKTYYVSVEDPVETLRTISGEQNDNSVDASGKLLKPLETAAGKINFVKFNDEHQSADRATTLKSHDSIIASITSELGNKVFFMYTSASSDTPLKRQRRQASDSSEGSVVRDGANILLYFKSLSIVQEENTTEFDMRSGSVKHYNETAMSVTLTPTSGSILTFDISLDGGYYYMTNVVYNNDRFFSGKVYAPTDFSYFCGNLTLNNMRPNLNVPKVTLLWNSLQFQAPFGYTKNESFIFSEPWDCVGFFTGGILSGLLVVVLLLTITFTGICWMMDINTMDRFDDPKGKTITINASE